MFVVLKVVEGLGSIDIIVALDLKLQLQITSLLEKV
jgi:hypothetical protein